MLNFSIFDLLKVRLHQGHQTTAYPKTEPSLPERFCGRPILQSSRCLEGCSNCSEVCPSGAIQRVNDDLRMDLGRCLFCRACEDACPQKGISFTPEYRMATQTREDLLLGPQEMVLASALEKKMLKVFGRSLKLRQVSAGGCNACEADVNVLGTIGYDLGRFGIQFVASPRHADGLLVTGPVSENMRTALLETYKAIPSPKIVIAVGACAISGGIFATLPDSLGGTPGLLPVDLFIPGCPPHPYTILDGLLRLLGRLDGKNATPRRQHA